MRLYATVTSEKKGREARKGGDERLEIRLYSGNRHEYTISYEQDRLRVDGDGGVLLDCTPIEK